MRQRGGVARHATKGEETRHETQGGGKTLDKGGRSKDMRQRGGGDKT